VVSCSGGEVSFQNSPRRFDNVSFDGGNPMAATVVNIGDDISEPLTLLAAISLPRSGSINDVKLAYNKSLLGQVTIIDLGAGTWEFDFVNTLPAIGNLIITSGVESSQIGSTRLPVVRVDRDSDNAIIASVREILFTAANDVTVVANDLNFWVKIQKSVF